MRRIFTLISTLVLCAFLITGVRAADASKSYQIEADYTDVVQDIENGVTDAGLSIDYRGNISKMLDRTGKDLGSAKKIYKAAQFMQFCSANLSRQMMEADASNMGVCPYIVFVYETVAKPGIVHVGYKRPIGAKGAASQKALGKIEALLDGIVKEAVGQ